MTGEQNLQVLLQTLSPTLLDGEFVFLSFAQALYGDHAGLQPIASFVEAEGLTLVVPKAIADQQNKQYDAAFKAITLKVHSSLEAVGLTAAFAQQLSSYGISANVFAGYFHDHIFVASEDADNAIEALNALSKNVI